MTFSIRLHSGKEIHYDHPVVMGIINLTPDSFFAGSRTFSTADIQRAEELVRLRVTEMVRAGAEIIDVGACSTRPGYTPPSADEELRRLEWGLPIIMSTMHEARCRRRLMADGLFPKDTWGDDPCLGCPVDANPLPVSVDTYRASVAEAVVSRFGVDIINDVYGGTRDPEILSVVARTGATYILTADSNDVSGFFHQQLAALSSLTANVSPSTVILDPGYGFSKNVDENYDWMRRLPELIAEFKEFPMLVGISRKSMIYKLLGTDPEHSLNGTTVLNAYSLMAGAHILRVHDVGEAIEAVRIVSKLKDISLSPYL